MNRKNAVSLTRHRRIKCSTRGPRPEQRFGRGVDAN